jgi:ComF family protein
MEIVIILLLEKLYLFFSTLQRRIGHRHCYICHQSSSLLICEHCVHEAVLPLFPAPGHNLLNYEAVQKNLAPPAYEALYSLGKYEGVIAGLINQLKFSKQLLAAQVLTAFFVQYLGVRLSISHDLPEALVPIPLSHRRYVQRQFNQSRVLSQRLAKEFGLHNIDALKRVKHTKQQSKLNKEDRQSNVKGAFVVVEDIHVNSIAIIDDVVTTGATINEACACLLDVYPDLHISVWSMAVTVRS